MDGFDALVRALMRRCAHVCGTDKLLTLFHFDSIRAKPIAFAVVGHCGLYGRCRSGLTFEVGPCPWGCLVGGLCALAPSRQHHAVAQECHSVVPAQANDAEYWKRPMQWPQVS